MKKELSGSFLPFKVKRTFLFLFTRQEDKINKWMKGYNHVCLAEYINDEFIIIYEPLYNGCNVCFRAVFDPEELKEFKVIEVVVHPVRQQILLKPLFQTCATIVQYLAAISLGCITCQGLFSKLTKTPLIKLRDKGIQEIKEWA